jgi:hypothetical protein
MRTPILEYVSDLSLNRVTSRQKAALVIIAGYYEERYASANVAMSTVAFCLLIDQRWLRRLITGIDKTILEYTPGRGTGNFSSFRFPEFEAQKDKGGQKGVISGSSAGHERVSSDTPIRKDLNPDLSQNQNPPAVGAAGVEISSSKEPDLAPEPEWMLDADLRKAHRGEKRWEYLVERQPDLANFEEERLRCICEESGLSLARYLKVKAMQHQSALPEARKAPHSASRRVS